MCPCSGAFRGGSRGSLEPPSGSKSFNFHGEFQEILCEIRQTNLLFLHLNPHFRNPGYAPAMCVYAVGCVDGQKVVLFAIYSRGNGWLACCKKKD